MKKQTDRKQLPCQCLDLVEAAHRQRVYPLMYCHMDLLDHLDADRLKRSIAFSSRIVPEILYAYDFKKACFVYLGHTAADAIRYTAGSFYFSSKIDLARRPQLQIFITPNGAGDRVTVAMSHLLSDGAGFLQYLYLLAAIYNGDPPDKKIQNLRDISCLLKNVRVPTPTERPRCRKHPSMPPLRSSKSGGLALCLITQIPADDLARIRRKAKQYGATLNDAFLTAYARTIARLQNQNAVVLPCPADLRRSCPGADALTVANMTGIYRGIAVKVPPACSFTAILQQVHTEVVLQRSRFRCFAGIKALNELFHKIPHSLLERAIKALYPLPPVSYTNLGSIDPARLSFKDCTIQDCFFTGAYRLPPDFQLTISTFKNRCTLNCTLIGSIEDKERGQFILEQVKYELLKWIAPA